MRPVKTTTFWLAVEAWTPVAFWCVLIFYCSTIPHLRFLKNGWEDFIFRKAGHMGIFGILARLMSRALVRATAWPWKRIFVFSLAFTILYACTDEYHQSFTSGRTPAVHDVVIDGLGAWLALGIIP